MSNSEKQLKHDYGRNDRHHEPAEPIDIARDLTSLANGFVFIADAGQLPPGRSKAEAPPRAASLRSPCPAPSKRRPTLPFCPSRRRGRHVVERSQHYLTYW